MSDELSELIKNEGQIIKIFVGKETITDPFEKSMSISLINPISVRALVTDMVSSQSTWKMPGIITSKAKEVILPSTKRDLIEMSQKIEIDGEDYVGWRENGTLQIRQEGSYIKLYCYIKTTE